MKYFMDRFYNENFTDQDEINKWSKVILGLQVLGLIIVFGGAIDFIFLSCNISRFYAIEFVGIYLIWR